MKSLFKVLTVLLLVLGCGCVWLKHHNQTAISSEANSFVQNGKVLDADRLKAGGKLLLVPFKAGEDVMATAELDRLALMIVKGISEKLQGSGAPFEILFAQNAEKAELILEGHFTKIRNSSRIRKWMLMDKGKSLAVSGKMVDRKTGKTILVFTDSKQNQEKKKTFSDLGRDIGYDIGDYILELVHQSAD